MRHFARGVAGAGIDRMPMALDGGGGGEWRIPDVVMCRIEIPDRVVAAFEAITEREDEVVIATAIDERLIAVAGGDRHGRESGKILVLVTSFLLGKPSPG